MFTLNPPSNRALARRPLRDITGDVIGTSYHNEQDYTTRQGHWRMINWLDRPSLVNMIRTGVNSSKQPREDEVPWLNPCEPLFVVTGHGSRDTFTVTLEDETSHAVNGAELADALHQDSECSNFLRSHPEGAIFLASCHTGRLRGGMAQQLANAIRRRVYAPVGVLASGSEVKDKQGRLTVGSGVEPDFFTRVIPAWNKKAIENYERENGRYQPPEARRAWRVFEPQ